MINTKYTTSNDLFVLNYLRAMDSPSRTELMSSIDKEEQTAKDELAENPNLKVEQKLSSVIEELRCLRLAIAGGCAPDNTSYTSVPQYTYTSVCPPKCPPKCPLKCPLFKKNNVDVVDNSEKDDSENTINLFEDCMTCPLFSGDWSPLWWLFFIVICISISLPTKSQSRLFL